MKNSFNTTWLAIKKVLSNKNYLWLFIISFVVLFSLFIIIPIFAVEGNDLVTQITILTYIDYITITLLSLVYSVFIAMQVYIMKQRKKAKEIGSVVGGSAGALFAGIVGTAFCPACIAPLFAFFGIGLGGLLFALEYRVYIVSAIIILMLIAIYFTAKKIMMTCNSCSI